MIVGKNNLKTLETVIFSINCTNRVGFFPSDTTWGGEYPKVMENIWGGFRGVTDQYY